MRPFDSGQDAQYGLPSTYHSRMVWMPNVQRINPTKADANGKRLVAFDLRLIPISGNDEIRVVTSF